MIETRAGGVICQVGDDGSLTIHLAATKRVSPQALAVAAELVPDLMLALQRLGAAAGVELARNESSGTIGLPTRPRGCPICGRRDTHTHPESP